MTRFDFRNFDHPLTDRILDFIGDDGVDYIYDRNPIADALRNNKYLYQDLMDGVSGMSMAGLSRAYLHCQMIVVGNNNGIEGDGEDKGIRRAWYSFWKVDFAQPIAESMDLWEQSKGNWTAKSHTKKRWDAELSKTMAWFVDERNVTYHDMYISDTSRMMYTSEEELFKKANIIIAIEKDSLINDFVDAARSLGAKAIISGSGQPSKAATERMLREFFKLGHISDEWGYVQPLETTIDYSHPAIVLTITDHDKAGKIIEGAFAEQLSRYIDHIRDVRVGVHPFQVRDAGLDPEEKSYSLNLRDKGDFRFAEEEAMIYMSCDCGTVFTEQRGRCGTCWTELAPQTTFDKHGEAWGFEVESVPTRDYRKYIVDALLEAIDYDYIIEKLREEAVADPLEAAWDVRNYILNNNKDIRAIQIEINRLNEIKDRVLDEATNEFTELGEQHKGDFAHEGETPDQQRLYEHVQDAHGSVWRPFKQWRRTKLLVDLLKTKYSGTVDKYTSKKVEW